MEKLMDTVVLMLEGSEVTLEIFCVQPIRIYPNVEICQIYYHDIDGEYDTYKHGKYQNNTGIQPSMLWKDFEKMK